MLSGRAWVLNAERQLKGAFKRADAIDALDPLSQDVAQHLVVLVAGWMEQSAFELARERCRQNVSGPVLAFALSFLGRTRNASVDHLLEIVGRFDEVWRAKLEDFITEDRKTAISSVIGLRNNIAHGEAANARTSVARVEEYYKGCREVIHFMADILDPV